jgi:hypothetical protein
VSASYPGFNGALFSPEFQPHAFSSPVPSANTRETRLHSADYQGHHFGHPQTGRDSRMLAGDYQTHGLPPPAGQGSSSAGGGGVSGDGRVFSGEYLAHTFPASAERERGLGGEYHPVHFPGLPLPAPTGGPTSAVPPTSSLFADQVPPRSVGPPQDEEISTIFVVGFPDDMQEREFQNMFVFSPGFEAATLKIPASTAAARERAAAPVVDSFGMPYVDRAGYEDSFGNLPLGDPLNHVLGQRDQTMPPNSSNPGSRKQIIGFAKFRTRIEALEARDVLSGRKVDAEKGSVLKAEMAKKNLHTKRGLANDAGGVGNPAGNASNVQGSSNSVAVAALLRERERVHLQNAAAFDAFHSVPADAQRPPRSSQHELHHDTFSVPPGYTLYQSNGTRAAAPESDAVDARWQGPASAPSQPSPPDQGSESQSPSSSSSALASSPRMRSPLGHPSPFGKSLLQQLDDDLPPIAGPPGFQGQQGQPSIHAFYATGSDEVGYSGSGHGLNSHHTFAHHAGGVASRLAGLSLNTSVSNNSNTSSPGTSVTSPASFPRTQNPADANPPINTLYVGGLPAVSNNVTIYFLLSLSFLTWEYKGLAFAHRPHVGGTPRRQPAGSFLEMCWLQTTVLPAKVEWAHVLCRI